MPVNKIVVIDTSILCAWLDVPGKETCGPDDDRWKELAVCNHSLGDASIVDVANFYSSMKRPVEIFTADAGLKAHEPVAPKREMERPRRYRK